MGGKHRREDYRAETCPKGGGPPHTHVPTHKHKVAFKTGEKHMLRMAQDTGQRRLLAFPKPGHPNHLSGCQTFKSQRPVMAS